MSTRSIIVVHGEDLSAKSKVVRLYKHSDGYPTGALSVIQEALVTAQKHKYEDYKSKESRINVSTMVGLLIGSGTSEYGMGVVIDDLDVEAEFSPEHIGDQWDLEWIYVLDLRASTLSIYSGDFTHKKGKPRGTKYADPFSYVKCLVKDAQEDARQETEKLIRYIEAWGFKVNPTKKSNVIKMKMRGAR